MVGSVAETEDIVQEAFLRLHRARQEGVIVESPKAYLAALDAPDHRPPAIGSRSSPAAGIRLVRVEVNGQPGAKFVDQRDRVVGVFALDIAEGKVECVRSW